jgi:hypothetical protein
MSRDRWDTPMFSSGGFMIPKIALSDFRGPAGFVERELVFPTHKALKVLQRGFINLLVGGQQDDLM